ncbi:RPL27A [Cordylochernes scorpioides]|uniref:Large ribosomal subunit protein uL15 n=1 Tax=Cordylochernes scorpioides TaxID=51811 RepID=A0ABY6JXT7_9ARAC|nr:RPL27A [Cordylochernes scorpioides]
MGTSDRKTRKLRGHVSHDHGRIGNKHHKHSGSHGNADSLTHHRINLDKYHPSSYFGKVGTSTCTLTLSTAPPSTWTRCGLWCLRRPGSKENKDGKVPVINVVQNGYYKVLGKGMLPKQPVIVKASCVVVSYPLV